MVQRMEMGYWGDADRPRGADEIRSLALRLGRLGPTLERLLGSLTSALTSRAADERRHGIADVADARRLAVRKLQSGKRGATPEDAAKLEHMEGVLESIVSGEPSDPIVRGLARESWDVLASEADRIGSRDLKARLEDAALRILDPEAMEDVEARLSGDPRATPGWMEAQSSRLADLIESRGLEVLGIEGRVKNVASIWRKMEIRDLPLELIQDVFAFRLIVPDVDSCYAALRALHEDMNPRFLRFKDYIADPKPNGYRSIHTCLHDEHGSVFEVQIRTPEMHADAEWGRTAHWLYERSKSTREQAG